MGQLGTTAFTLLNELVTAGQAGSKQDPYVRDVLGADRVRIAAGSSALVSGAATVKTGLQTVNMFIANPYGTATGFAAGVTEVNQIIVSGTTGPIATGDVAVLGVWIGQLTGVAKISASGTAAFSWLAIGT